MSTEQKVAVITGASRGIGAALVKAYRERRYRVVATARSVKPSNDANILAVPGDIADRKTAERVISEGVARFGRIDTLVNNAGIFIAKPFTKYTEADYGAMLGVNVSGFFHITQLAIAEMEKHGSGHVVQITTSSGRQCECPRPVHARVADEGQPECGDHRATGSVPTPSHP
jgi:NAD(P)-dependent dehydrogenase (short-subunit alcohol dehydrogenase family)